MELKVKKDDYQIVKEFLDQCTSNGLEIECIVHALRNSNNGMKISDACSIALREWDCEPIDAD